MIDGHGNAAAGILEDDPAVEFSETVVARYSAADHDVLSYGRTRTPAQRFEISNGQDFAVAVEAGFGGFVAGRAEQEQGAEQLSASVKYRLHRVV